MSHEKLWWNQREDKMDFNVESASQRQKNQLVPESQPTQKPVAYDSDGKPLYAAPPDQVPINSPYPQPSQVVHVARATEPIPVEVSAETKRRHDESMKHFDNLNLSDHEYVISAVRRHPIGMLAPLIATAFSISLMLILVFNYPYISEVLGLSTDMFGLVLLMGVMLMLLFLIGGYLAVWVYTNNRFFLTNESVIQEIQSSIFSRKEQTVSLMNIEDASYSQRGPLQSILDYGSIRLSTEGEETTYRFDYVSSPKSQIAILNNAVEAFKNGRPVVGPADDNENN
ncbi:PH domain-containing protein [Microbacteriaceae bacterium]|nr:PH domain-containing protein [Candidatus Saccharibacteria bacterium]